MTNFQNLPNLSEYGYQILQVLGRNSSGWQSTYKATNIKTGQLVAIKMFQFNTNNASWSDFNACKQEIDVLQKINHPCIPRYLNSFEIQNGTCLVQEYKDAPSLSQLPNLSLLEIKQIAVALLEVLVYLQQKNPPIFHRDIKPENILIDGSDPKKVYLVDFGFARLGTGESGASSAIKGTFGFLPPEQFRNSPLTKASDLYSLGATIICLLTNTRSGDIGNLIDPSYKFNLKSLKSKISSRFLNWLAKITAPDPKNRYSNAASALKALKSINPLKEADSLLTSLPIRLIFAGISMFAVVKVVEINNYLNIFPIPTVPTPTSQITPSPLPTPKSSPTTFPPETKTSELPTKNTLPCQTLSQSEVIDAAVISTNIAKLDSTRDCTYCDLRHTNLQNRDLIRTNLSASKLICSDLSKSILKLSQISSADLREVNLSGADLSEANLSNSNLIEANLTEANLTKASLGSTNLSKANLIKAKLITTNLQYANLTGANLTEADLTKESNLSSATLIGANFTKALLKGANLTNTKLREAKFSGADLIQVKLGGADLTEVNLSNLNLSGASLGGANLTKADLSNAKLLGANLEYADLTEAILKSADFTKDAKLSYAKLRRADLSGANLERASLNSTDFLEAKLLGTNLVNASINNANFTEAKLNGINLSSASLGGTNFTKADLSNANLRGANLEYTDLTDANLKGADFTKDTKLSAAKLRRANLTDANLKGVNLSNTDLTDANFCNAIMPDGSKGICK